MKMQNVHDVKNFFVYKCDLIPVLGNYVMWNTAQHIIVPADFCKETSQDKIKYFTGATIYHL